MTIFSKAIHMSKWKKSEQSPVEKKGSWRSLGKHCEEDMPSENRGILNRFNWVNELFRACRALGVAVRIESGKRKCSHITMFFK
jgi:hypothetical protein